MEEIQNLELPRVEWKYEMRREMQLILPGLYLGPSDPSKSLPKLHAAGITGLLVMRSAHEAPFVKPRFPQQFEYLVLDDVADTDTQNLIRVLPTVRDFIDRHVAQGGRVLVHDDGGISRAPAIVVMYVMQKYRLSFEDALQFVQSRRYCMHINQGFLHQIKEFEALAHAFYTQAQQPAGSMAPRNKRAGSDEPTEGTDDRKRRMGD